MHKCQVLGLYLVPVQYDIDWVIGLFRSETIVPPTTPFFVILVELLDFQEDTEKTV